MLGFQNITDRSRHRGTVAHAHRAARSEQRSQKYIKMLLSSNYITAIDKVKFKTKLLLINLQEHITNQT